MKKKKEEESIAELRTRFETAFQGALDREKYKGEAESSLFHQVAGALLFQSKPVAKTGLAKLDSKRIQQARWAREFLLFTIGLAEDLNAPEPPPKEKPTSPGFWDVE